MELLYRSRNLGTITKVEGEGFWMYGRFSPGPAVTRELAEFFRFMTSEEGHSKDPPFSDELLADESWEVIDDSGTRRGITLPFVHPDKLIAWRWRDTAPANKPKKRRRKSS
jgi:hypothetical protein